MIKLKDRPMVGVGVIIRKDNKILLGKRKGAHGAGEWSFPGGHLEYKEDILECAKREVLEEVGIEITNLKQFAYSNNIFEEEGWHYVTLYVLADHMSGEATLMEPEKCSEWGWFKRDEIPSPRFGVIQTFMEGDEWPKVWK